MEEQLLQEIAQAERAALEAQKADIEALLAEMDSLAERAKQILGE